MTLKEILVLCIDIEQYYEDMAEEETQDGDYVLYDLHIQTLSKLQKMRAKIEREHSLTTSYTMFQIANLIEDFEVLPEFRLGLGWLIRRLEDEIKKKQIQKEILEELKEVPTLSTYRA